MKCPYCNFENSRVIDSRIGKDKSSIRRRRACERCDRRFTTFERVELTMPLLIKKDGRREPWDRRKLAAGLEKACEKLPVGAEQIDAFVDAIEQKVQDHGSKEVPTAQVGEWVMEALPALHEVAYVRFASVYRQFRDVNEFMDELKHFLGEQGKR